MDQNQDAQQGYLPSLTTLHLKAQPGKAACRSSELHVRGKPSQPGHWAGSPIGWGFDEQPTLISLDPFHFVD